MRNLTWFTALSIVGASAAAAAESAPRFPKLAALGEKFTFAIVADPQVGHAEAKGEVPANSRRTLMQTVEELNALQPATAFTVFLGDLVNTFDEKSVANFEACIRPLTVQPILVHGNHDTRPPFDGYKALNRRVSSVEDMWYSFEAGPWHLVVLACNVGEGEEGRKLGQEMADWLAADLAAHRDRPTIVFEHLHLLPQGLTQLEYYTFPLDLRLRLLDTLARHGNVRYFFNGHVHNGLKASVKTSWHYRGIDFITAPTGTRSRNFGEEYAEFARGPMDGGYYLLVEVEGAKLRLRGRLAGEARTFTYPAKLREFHEAVEPRWFRTLPAFEPAEALVNGDFANGLAGWQPCYRYIADELPGFAWGPGEKAGRQAMRVLTRAMPPEHWANDELTELYQIVRAPGAGRPMLAASYLLEEPPRNGGGYIRLVGMRDQEFRCTMMFNWGENADRTTNTPRSFGYAIHGTSQNAPFLRNLGRRKQGFYWNVPASPGAWHELRLDLAGLHDAAVGQSGAFEALGIDKWMVAVGTWVNREPGSVSEAHFTGLNLTGAAAPAPSTVDGQPLRVDESVFSTEFGAAAEAPRTRPARAASRPG